MKYLHLIWAGLFRRKVLTILTLLSILVAFLLFGLLDMVRSTLAGFGQNAAGYNRLFAMSKANVGNPLPVGLFARIKDVPGLSKMSYGSFFGGTYQNPRNFVNIEARADNNNYFLDFYPDVEISPAERLAFSRLRTGAVAGELLAKKYNWKVGDKIPIEGIVPQKNGSTTWTFDLVGTYRFTDPSVKVFEDSLYINWDFLDEARQSGNGTVSWFILKANSPAENDRVAQAVDAMTANSSHETRTQNDNALSADLISQFGDLGLITASIMGAVFFTLVLLTGHTVTQAMQERVTEIAVLKTIGFSGWTIMSLVLGESVLLLLLGSVLGLGIATIAVGAVRTMLENTVSISILPLPIVILPVGGIIWLRGLLIAIFVALIVGAVPAFRGMRLRIADALSSN